MNIGSKLELAEKAGVSHGAIVNCENENSNDADVYALIDELLKERHMSRRQLAIAAGIPEASLASAFRRKSPSFPIERLNKIANVLNVPAQSFFDALNDNHPTEDQTLHDLLKIYRHSDTLYQKAYHAVFHLPLDRPLLLYRNYRLPPEVQ